MTLSLEQYQRYSRHLLLSEVGKEGQRRLLEAKVLLVGAGGLGCPAAFYLAAAGVGRIGVVDDDVVELSNLQRQILHTNAAVGEPKAVSAQQRLGELNPDVDVRPLPVRLTSHNALEIMRDWDIVLDGSDNFPTRYLVNDACVLLNKPCAYGAVLRFEGQASFFQPGEGPCYRCLFPEPPPPHSAPSCGEAGVLGVVPGVIGMIQATETIKWILGQGESLVGRLLLFDALRMSFREVKLKRDPTCAVCGETPSIAELIDYEGFCGLAPAEDEADGIPQMSVRELKAKMDANEDFLLVDVREEEEYEIVRLPGAELIEFSGFFGEGVTRLTPHKDREICVICHVGERSNIVCRYLRARGFTKLRNVVGGIDAWANIIDPALPRY